MIRKNSDVFFLIVSGCVVIATAAYAKKVRTKMDKIRGNLATSTNVTKNLRRQLTGLSQDVARYQDVLENYDQKIEVYQNELNQQDEIKSRQQTQIANMQKVERKLREQRRGYRDRISILESNIRDMEENLDNAKTQVLKSKELKEEIAAMKEREDLDMKLDKKDKEEDSFLGLSLMDAEKEYKKYKKRVVKLNHELEETKERLAKAKKIQEEDLKLERERIKKIEQRKIKRMKEEITFLNDQVETLSDDKVDAQIMKKRAEREAERAVTQVAGTTKRNQDLLDDTANMHYNLGVIFTQRSEYKKALQEYKQSLQLNPADADAHYNIAILYDDVFDDSEMALSHYRAYLKLRPKDKDAKRLKKWIIDKEAEVMVRDKSLIDYLKN